jgi:hypothetical protein
MDSHEQGRLPQDLSRVEERLAASRPEVSPLELDRIKLRAMSQASRQASPQRKGLVMRSKLVTMLLVLGLVVSGGSAGIIAGNGNDNNGNGSSGQYKPGKGCGDDNHTHTGPPGNPGNTNCPPQAGGKK